MLITGEYEWKREKKKNSFYYSCNLNYFKIKLLKYYKLYNISIYLYDAGVTKDFLNKTRNRKI